MKKEQSSIEWLIEQIGETGFSHITDMESLIKEAKQLHKKEIIEAYKDGRSDQQSDKKDRFYNRTSIGYYNEKYKTNDKSRN